MLSKTETSCSAPSFVDDGLANGRAALEAPSEDLRLFAEWSPSEGGSFFFIAMRPGPGARTCRRDQSGNRVNR